MKVFRFNFYIWLVLKQNGVSKVITDYIKIGQDYGNVKKMYSVNIVYFSIGQGYDYSNVLAYQ